jgi:hypothetical protein
MTYMDHAPRVERVLERCRQAASLRPPPSLEAGAEWRSSIASWHTRRRLK